MKSKLTFLKHTLEPGKNGLLKSIVESELRKGTINWMKAINKYMIEPKISVNEIRRLSTNKIIDKIYAYDENLWRNDVENKSAFKFYNYKTDIGEIKWFRNSLKFAIMMRTRSDTLDLAWRDW